MFLNGLLGIPWVSLGYPLGIPWVSLGYPLGIPWVSDWPEITPDGYEQLQLAGPLQKPG